MADLSKLRVSIEFVSGDGSRQSVHTAGSDELPQRQPGKSGSSHASWTSDDVKAIAEAIGDRERHVMLFLTDPGRLYAMPDELEIRFGYSSKMSWEHLLPRLHRETGNRPPPLAVLAIDDVQALRVAWDEDLISAFRKKAKKVLGIRNRYAQ